MSLLVTISHRAGEPTFDYVLKMNSLSGAFVSMLDLALLGNEMEFHLFNDDGTVRLPLKKATGAIAATGPC